MQRACDCADTTPSACRVRALCGRSLRAADACGRVVPVGSPRTHGAYHTSTASPDAPANPTPPVLRCTTPLPASTQHPPRAPMLLLDPRPSFSAADTTRPLRAGGRRASGCLRCGLAGCFGTASVEHAGGQAAAPVFAWALDVHRVRSPPGASHMRAHVPFIYKYFINLPLLLLSLQSGQRSRETLCSAGQFVHPAPLPPAPLRAPESAQRSSSHLPPCDIPTLNVPSGVIPQDACPDMRAPRDRSRRFNLMAPRTQASRHLLHALTHAATRYLSIARAPKFTLCVFAHVSYLRRLPTRCVSARSRPVQGDQGALEGTVGWVARIGNEGGGKGATASQPEARATTAGAELTALTAASIPHAHVECGPRRSMAPHTPVVRAAATPMRPPSHHPRAYMPAHQSAPNHDGRILRALTPVATSLARLPVHCAIRRDDAIRFASSIAPPRLHILSTDHPCDGSRGDTATP
ncbi:hypothetical protein HYPSUDRAFT_204726 [Hypholoma sublateritium FD-334 SS-4]|uniref:Uncharacterized protein n=1 Tax=Hypholoma sublateritium (strain FD-334 SS-4) TaxID=945553 RepID=A0A0D2NKB7_HYPSF|nr:hypothetical protein HYPSUDRAFT_204726 [Hypholoma sublateritium FD-334 SS-4]